TRADVANTIYYRRRKGTLPMLEELARDVTGWAAHAVEFLELLGWTQHLEHLRPQAGWFDLRSLARAERVDGPFDQASHTVAPRPATRPSGKVISIDVVAGRLAVGNGFAGSSRLDVDFHYGFPADIGGGRYERRKWLVADDPVAPLERYEVLEGAASPRFGSVAAALSHWASPPVGRPSAVITILDSRTYSVPATINLSDLSRLTIQADNGQRPVLTTAAGGLAIAGDGAAPDPEQRGWLTLSGIVVEGFLHVTGDVGGLRLLHATVVPGRTIADGAPPGGPAIVVEATGSGGGPV